MDVFVATRNANMKRTRHAPAKLLSSPGVATEAAWALGAGLHPGPLIQGRSPKVLNLLS